MMRRTFPSRVIGVLGTGAVSATLALAGCGGTTGGSSTSGPPQDGVPFNGRLMSGQQPIANAVIQMYAAGDTGYGAGASSLLRGQVNTAADGTFAIANNYTCPTQSSEIYLVARGGSTIQS